MFYKASLKNFGTKTFDKLLWMKFNGLYMSYAPDSITQKDSEACWNC